MLQSVSAVIARANCDIIDVWHVLEALPGHVIRRASIDGFAGCALTPPQGRMAFVVLWADWILSTNP